MWLSLRVPCRIYKAECGRQVRSGRRQPIPSNTIESYACVSVTVPLSAYGQTKTSPITIPIVPPLKSGLDASCVTGAGLSTSTIFTATGRNVVPAGFNAKQCSTVVATQFEDDVRVDLVLQRQLRHRNIRRLGRDGQAERKVH